MMQINYSDDDNYEEPSYDEDDEDDVNSRALLMKEDNIYFKNVGPVIFIYLNSRFIERIFGEIQIFACHATGMKGLVNLVKLQKKKNKKQISAYCLTIMAQ